jgi:hypothetical protein
MNLKDELKDAKMETAVVKNAMETEVALLEDNLSFAGDLVNDKINTL